MLRTSPISRPTKLKDLLSSKEIARLRPAVVAASFTMLLSGCHYGSPNWNTDMSLSQKADVARAHFYVGQPIAEVEQKLESLDVQTRRVVEPVGVLPAHSLHTNGGKRWEAVLWHSGPNFASLSQTVGFYFDDDFVLTEVWIERYVPRRDPTGYTWDDEERTKYPFRLVPP